MDNNLENDHFSFVPTDTSALNLDFHIREEALGIFDPETNKWVKHAQRLPKKN